MSFNLENYENVKSRKKRFYVDYPDGRILVKLQNENILEYALFCCNIYKNKEDQEKNLIFASGNALEIRETEKLVSRSGSEYESVNYSSWCENAEESAVGRALDNAGYNNGFCSKEEIVKAKKDNNSNNTSQKQKEKYRGNQKIALAMISKITDDASLKNFYDVCSRYDWNESELVEQTEFLKKQGLI